MIDCMQVNLVPLHRPPLDPPGRLDASRATSHGARGVVSLGCKLALVTILAFVALGTGSARAGNNAPCDPLGGTYTLTNPGDDVAIGLNSCTDSGAIDTMSISVECTTCSSTSDLDVRGLFAAASGTDGYFFKVPADHEVATVMGKSQSGGTYGSAKPVWLGQWDHLDGIAKIAPTNFGFKLGVANSGIGSITIRVRVYATEPAGGGGGTDMTATNTKLDTIHADLGDVNTKLDTANTHLDSMDSTINGVGGLSVPVQIMGQASELKVYCDPTNVSCDNMGGSGGSDPSASHRADLTWWGVWALVGLMLVLLIAPRFLRAFAPERGLG